MMQSQSSNKLLEIFARTPMPFDDYMMQALYHPEWGYYTSRVDFGVAGDFVTAPTLTPSFTQALGYFMLSEPLDDVAVIELGPGNGQLAYDLLLFLEQEKKLPTQYYLVETSDYLKKKQAQRLQTLPAHLFDLVKWVEFEDLKAIKAIVLANEFFDALPVVRFQVFDTGVQELYVAYESDRLIEVPHPPRAELVEFVAPLNLPIGYTSEVCFAYKNIAQKLQQMLSAGIVLIIDYGYPEQEYYQPTRTQGTLQAYYQHQASSSYLEQPGFMDLTAHVNFSYLSHCLLAADFTFDFFTFQNVFLLDQGINENLEQKPAGEQQKIKRLLDPRLMGEGFKVLAFSKHHELRYAPTYDLARFL
jgi:SAM-dependent MidA family methyltransferase